MNLDLAFKDRYYLVKFLDHLLDDTDSYIYFDSNTDMLEAIKRFRSELFKDGN